MKILIFGGAGTGKTTLGKEIAKRTDFVHLDSDIYYWKKTDPPFTEKIPLIERNKRIKIDFENNENAIVTGSMASWGKEWETAFDLVIFLYLENRKRMARLKNREFERYGNKLFTDKVIKESSQAFLDWANQYDNPNFEGTNLNFHIEWIEKLDCKILKINGRMELNEKIEFITQEIKLVEG